MSTAVRFGIRARLAALEALVVAGFALAVAVSAWLVGEVRIGGEQYRAIRREEVATRQVAALQTSLHEMLADLLTLASEPSVERRALLARTIQQRVAVVDEQFAAAIGDAPDENVRISLDDARGTWVQFSLAVDAEVLPAVAAGRQAEAQALLRGTQQRRYVRFAEQLTNTVDAYQSRIRGLEAAADETLRRSVRIAAGAALALLAALLGGAFLLGRSILRPLSALDAAASRAAGGKLGGAGLPAGRTDEIGQLARAFQAMLAMLRDVLSRAQATGRQLDGASQELLAASSQLSAGARRQSTQLADAAREMGGVSSSSREVSESCAAMASAAAESAALAAQGEAAMQDATKGFEAVRVTSAETAAAVQALARASERIDLIVESVQEFTAETNLIAINAGIEAARAGEAGRGFTVVAAEVLSLAQRSAASVKEIRDVVGGTHQHVRAAGSSVARGMVALRSGGQCVENATVAFGAIHAKSRQTNEAIGAVTAVVSRQVESVARASQLLDDVAGVARNALQATEGIVTEGDRLHQIVRDLERVLARFELEDAGRGEPPAAPPEALAAEAAGASPAAAG